jgi:hypothetical protein
VDLGQLYGYAVCFVAVLTFLIGTARLVGAVLDMRELPYTRSYANGPSLVSLGAYRIDLLRGVGAEQGGGAAASLIPPDSTLQRMFEAERLYRLALGHQTSRRTITVSVALLALATLLFAFHWTWLRRREGRSA